MTYEAILVEKVDKVGVITLNRPKELNTFNTQLCQELNDALGRIEKDSSTCVVLLKGAGRAFSAGADLSELVGKTTLECRKWARMMEDVNLTIAEMGKPVIVAAHGYAVANGIALVAAADLAIAAEGTKFGATAINVGLFCMGPAVPLSRSLSRKKVLELLMTGDMIDAHEAERIGLINKAVPESKLEVESMNLAGKLAAKSPLAMQLGKQSFYGMVDLDYRKAFAYTTEMFVDLITTRDAQEGISAFLEKRKPNYQGK